MRIYHPYCVTRFTFPKINLPILDEVIFFCDRMYTTKKPTVPQNWSIHLRVFLQYCLNTNRVLCSTYKRLELRHFVVAKFCAKTPAKVKAVSNVLFYQDVSVLLSRGSHFSK